MNDKLYWNWNKKYVGTNLPDHQNMIAWQCYFEYSFTKDNGEIATIIIQIRLAMSLHGQLQLSRAKLGLITFCNSAQF